jgi:hypothetical protein
MNFTKTRQRRFIAAPFGAVAQLSLCLSLASCAHQGKDMNTPLASLLPDQSKAFDFLEGEWRIQNRRLKDGTKDEWETFEGEATVWRAWSGAASIEWLRIPAKRFEGMGVRMFRSDTGQWADHWVNAKNGVLGDPLLGQFKQGVGEFLSEETVNGQRLLAKSVWDEITPTTCRWYQATSEDDGKTWSETWVMRWHRVP